MPIYERSCPNGHITEVFAKIADRHNPVSCRCGEETKLKVSPVKSHFDGSDPDFHDSHAKWVKRHEDANGKDDPVNLSHA